MREKAGMRAVICQKLCAAAEQPAEFALRAPHAAVEDPVLFAGLNGSNSGLAPPCQIKSEPWLT